MNIDNDFQTIIIAKWTWLVIGRMGREIFAIEKKNECLMYFFSMIRFLCSNIIEWNFLAIYILWNYSLSHEVVLKSGCTFLTFTRGTKFKHNVDIIVTYLYGFIPFVVRDIAGYLTKYSPTIWWASDSYLHPWNWFSRQKRTLWIIFTLIN